MVYYICEICEKSFNRKDNFIRHQSVHNGTKLKCECGNMVTAAALNRHKKTAFCKRLAQAAKSESNIIHCSKIKLKNIAVEVTHLKDGSTTIKHDTIEIEGIKYMLVPECLIDESQQQSELHEPTEIII